jgi:hypothetical protein
MHVGIADLPEAFPPLVIDDFNYLIRLSRVRREEDGGSDRETKR